MEGNKGRLDGKEKNRAEDEDEDEEKQEIWSWGAGTDGQLGTGRLQDEYLPQLIDDPCLSSVGPIVALACGGAHVIALTSGGRVVSWGRGISGQLGHGDVLNFPHPKIVTSLEGYFITHVSAGWNHSGFVSDNGVLFTCGDGSFGQLGHGDCKSHCSPVKISYFADAYVEQIACGMRHSLVLLRGHFRGQVYAFGSGKRGQLGISKDRVKLVCLPEATIGLDESKIVNIAANGDHSAALCADGHLYTWGRGFCGTSDVHCPIKLPASLSFTAVSLGWNHALLLTGIVLDVKSDGGEAFMLGGNYHGSLGNLDKISFGKNSPDLKESIMEEVSCSEGEKVEQIATGAEHSSFITEDGEIKTWGWGEHGQLGLGNTCDQRTPQVLSLGDKVQKKAVKIKIFCGSGFSIAIKAPYTHQT